MNDLYLQRAEAWMLAMAFAKELGYKVGIREPGEFPVHVIQLPSGKEVALHMSMEDIHPSVLKHPTDLKYDGHTNEEKSQRIREYVGEVFIE